MSGISALINSGLGGINVATAALQTTGNNISNVNTEGYTRQSVLQSERAGQFTGAGYLGTGAQVDGIARNYDAYLQNQMWQAYANQSSAGVVNDQLQQLNNVLADPNLGLSSALNGFFGAMQGVANNPAGVPERQALISNAQVLSARFNTLDDHLRSTEQSINTQLKDGVASVNELTRQIADLNQRIFQLQGNSSGQQPNDLLDQRDELITKLNAQIGITVNKQADGQLSLFTGNGQTLVAGGKSFALSTVASAYDPNRLEITYQPNGGVISNGISGGAIGGLLRFRSENLDATRNALGRIAVGVSAVVNQQQALGLDLKGALGQPLFSTPNPVVYGSQLNGTPSATLSAVVSDPGQLSASDYLAQYDGSNWTVTRSSDNAVVLTSASGPLNFDGVSVSVTGSANAGDKFLIEPTRQAGGAIGVQSTDPNGIAAAAPYVSNTGNNTGQVGISTGGVASASGSVNLPAGAFGQNLTITFTSSTSFQVSSGSPATVLATGSYAASGTSLTIPYPAGAGSAYWRVDLSGSPAVAGDSFTLSKAGVGDNRNILSMAALQTDKNLGNGTMTAGDAYGQLLTEVGTAGQQAGIGYQAQSGILTQIQHSQQAVSGVNLDEEAANLMRYQQAYQASARMIQVADTLFQTILSIKGA